MGFQLLQRRTDAVHTFPTDRRKTSGGVIPLVRERQHHGQQPFGFQSQRSIFQVMVRHDRIITGLFNTKNSHLRTSFL